MGRLEKLGREISYALRHAPQEYGLNMDEEGWVPVEQLIYALNQKPKWKNVSEMDIDEIIKTSDKKRYEKKNGRIRAFYGHSIKTKIAKELKQPPDVLYHGTARRFVASIMENGILPRGRQYAHLSQDVEMAKIVGLRHDDKPVILVIDAKKAWADGVKFYLGNENVWLADIVPVKYIKKM